MRKLAMFMAAAAIVAVASSMAEAVVTRVTDSATFATIQAAIDDAGTLDGETLNVADGTYTITAAILVNKGVTITGNVGSPQNVLVKYASPAGTNCFDVAANNVTVQGVKVTNGNMGFSLRVSSAAGPLGCKISNNIVDTCSDKGIYVRKCAATGEANRVEVTGNVLSGCGQSCIQTYVSPYTYIYGNTINATNDKGINIIRSGATEVGQRIQVIGNVISDAKWGGIQTDGSPYTYIYDNTINATDDKGINIIKSGATGIEDRIQVIGNVITGTKWQGIQVIGAPYTYVHDNTLTGCNYYGGDGTGDWDYASIHVDDDGAVSGAHVVIDGNTVVDGINGIQTWSDDVSITENDIYNMGATYGDTKDVSGRTYKNSGILVGSNWGSGDFDPSGVIVLHNNIYDNYWGLFQSDEMGNVVDANCNWWGNAAGPGVGGANAVSGNVHVPYWLDGPYPGGNCIPEPVTMMGLLAGLGGLAGYIRRRGRS